MKLEAGNTVALKSGNGPVMVIGQIGTASGPDIAMCLWGSDGVSHNHFGINRTEIPLAALKLHVDLKPEPLPAFRHA